MVCIIPVNGNTLDSSIAKSPVSEAVFIVCRVSYYSFFVVYAESVDTYGVPVRVFESIGHRKIP